MYVVVVPIKLPVANVWMDVIRAYASHPCIRVVGASTSATAVSGTAGRPARRTCGASVRATASPSSSTAPRAPCHSRSTANRLGQPSAPCLFAARRRRRRRRRRCTQRCPCVTQETAFGWWPWKLTKGTSHVPAVCAASATTLRVLQLLLLVVLLLRTMTATATDREDRDHHHHGRHRHRRWRRHRYQSGHRRLSSI